MLINGSIGVGAYKKPPVKDGFFVLINIEGFALQDGRSGDACWYFFSR